MPIEDPVFISAHHNIGIFELMERVSASLPESKASPDEHDILKIAILGRPNAGKSTLMNALIGEPLSIVTAKAQTTWQRITGILTGDDTQMVFLDTPGLLEPRDLLQRTMLSAALEALEEADVVLLVLDASDPPSATQKEFVTRSLEESRGVPLLAAVNKIDGSRE